jgi:hypothetical protein
MSGTPKLLGPDGRPLKALSSVAEPEVGATVWVDKTVTYTENNEQVKFSPADVLKAAARMLRDGKSLKHIANELGIEGLVEHKTLERAIIKQGMPLLQREIAMGLEPEESRIQIDRALRPISPDDPEDD